MRECYFTSKSIHEKSWEMLQELKRYRKGRKIDLKTGHAALLILDMQRFFLDEISHAHIPSASAIVQKVKNLMNVFLKNKLPVILTRHLNTEKDANLMGKWWKDLITEENPLSEIIPELEYSNAIVIKKTQYDAFYRTPLENLLKKKEITQIVITGVMTHICCETTSRSAFVRGFEVFFTIDGTATYDKDFHRATLLNLSHGFAVPVLCEEIKEQLGASQ
jgi:bifunctional isochorismate lyase/aryl carrier protein